MNVDTGSFRALEARADAMDAIEAKLSVISETVRAIAAGQFLASLERADMAGQRPAGPRHARHRERPAYLRLVGGGQ